MRSVLVSVVAKLVKVPLFCGIVVKPTRRMAEVFGRAEKRLLISRLCSRLAPDFTVKRGPFKGLKYPSAKSFGSALCPKMLGTYEHELHDVFDKTDYSSYTKVVDVGCAEGYYAVGLAMRCESAQVEAYDISPIARELCSELACANALQSRIEIKGYFDENEFERLGKEKKLLVVCDCEGFEEELFNANSMENLLKHDLLIEIHDHIDRRVETNLRALISKTHHVEEIHAVSDREKVANFELPELSSCSLQEQLLALGENRDNGLLWFSCTPK